MIRSIQVVNVRGIEDRTIVFEEPEMLPNKVHLLIASNGFGKSSIATAFDNLNQRRLSIKERDCHRHDETKLPRLTLVVRDRGEEVSLTADQTKNEIRKVFDTFVIRGPRKIKASQRPTETGYQVAVGEFVIEPIEVCKIPERADIPYKFREAVGRLGNAGKAAPNITDELSNIETLKLFLSSKWGEKEMGSKLREKYENILDRVRALEGRADEILEKIELELWADAVAVMGVVDLCNAFPHYNSRGKALLAALQLIEVGRSDLKQAKAAQRWLEYEAKYRRVKELVRSCNPNPEWIKAEVKQTGQSLLINLPKPDTMSNGQRDFLFFVSQLMEFELKAEKGKTILIIDEVFDYLDYANVIACQYFLKKFIDRYVDVGSQVYPLVLTHLDPSVFNSFVFSKKVQKNHYLDDVKHLSIEGGLGKIIRQRAFDPELERVFGSFHAHHSLTDCDYREMFESKALKKAWGCSRTFKAYCREQVRRYLQEGVGEVDYLAVCLGVRIYIESRACGQLTEEHQREFAEVKRRTIDKLHFAESCGADVPEIHYLLAGLYNSALHGNAGVEDFVTPVVTKLRNSCIREIIREAMAGDELSPVS